MREPAGGETKELSKKAKFRLAVFDRYRLKSLRFSQTGKPDARPACRHFGIQRSYYCRWKARYDKRRLSSLENRSAAPEKKREPEYSRELVREIREGSYAVKTCFSGPDTRRHTKHSKSP
jgi:transposase